MAALTTIPLTDEAAAKMLPARPKNAHKGTFGTLSVLAGSSRYRGAALLCAEGALRSGVGIVRLCSVGAVCAAAAVRLPQCTLLPLPQTRGGGIGANGAKTVLAQGQTAILAGCGLGNSRSTAMLVGTLLAGARLPLVLDADALNALAGHLDEGQDDDVANWLRGALDTHPGPVILTPHVGEMARLCKMSVEEVAKNRAAVATRYAAQSGCVVVLKSHQTLVAAPGGTLYATVGEGNPGLAKGGSGDVLAGVIASLAAQGLEAKQAAAAGVWLHAKAGRAAAKEYGFAGLSPTDLPLFLARELKALGL